MNRHSEQQLLDFCVVQHGRFDADAWRSQKAAAPEQTTCAMLYLSNAKWYGRRQELRELVNQSMAQPEAQPEGGLGGAPSGQLRGQLSELSSRIGFNRARFVERLQARLWQRSEIKR